jgi:hypothetical protein
MSIRFTRETSKVLWSELFPYEFKMRLSSMPVAYLPLGICEPHGFSLRSLEKEESSGGKFALNESAMEATADYGRQIIQGCVVSLMELVQSLTPEDLAPRGISMLRYEHMELIWKEIVGSDEVWATLQPRSGQPPVSEQSKWKPYEYARLNYLR